MKVLSLWYVYFCGYLCEMSTRPSLIAIYLRKGNEDYNLSDFEYKEMDTPEFKKRRLVEKNYEQLYLHIKAAGLIRKVSSAFYPKSFLREYADHTGLTKFIVGAEEKAGKKLKHDELAEQFFGSYDEWMTGFEKFLQNKLVILKIGE